MCVCRNTNIFVNLSMSVYTYLCMFICSNIKTIAIQLNRKHALPLPGKCPIYVYTCLFVCVYFFDYLYIYVCIYINLFIYVYTYAYIYSNIRTTNSPPPLPCQVGAPLRTTTLAYIYVCIYSFILIWVNPWVNPMSLFIYMYSNLQTNALPFPGWRPTTDYDPRIYVYIYIYIYLYICICIYICIYVYIYTYFYIRIHIFVFIYA